MRVPAVVLSAICLLAITCGRASSFSISANEAIDVLMIGKDVLLSLAKIARLIDSKHDTLFSDKFEGHVLRSMQQVNAKLNEISEKLEGPGTRNLLNIMHNLPQRLRLELKLNDLIDYLTRIHINYEYMVLYTSNETDVEEMTMEDFAKSVVSHDSSSTLSLMERIHSYIVPIGYGIQSSGLINLLQEMTEEVESDMRCNTHQSPQQILFSLYNTLALAELKGYTMINFSYMLLRLYEKGEFRQESKLAKARYQQRNKETIAALRAAMGNASRDLWRCDPKRYAAGENYVEVTQLLQGYIQNEVDLNAEGTCRETCSEYSYTKSHSCFKNLWCRQQKKCEGRVINCQYIDADMWVCPADSFSGRRYEYVEYENGRVLGRKLGCKRGTTKVDSWWRWLFWRCSYCFCLCDDPGEQSDRYFNLRSYVSDVKSNKVVTGLRFVKRHRIIHLQIQEGLLQSRANIDNTTLQWVPIDEYRTTDKNVRNGQDFHMLTWEKRALDLDDLYAREKEVVTGVRFKLLGSHLNLEIKVTPFNYTTGKLIDPANRSYWKDNFNTDASKNPRKEVKLNSPDVPTRTTLPSIPDSKHDQYILFRNTDMNKDAAQLTVPFIDSQPVVSLIPVPLSGVGVFHKGRDTFGGFIAPKIFTYDYSKHLIPLEV